MLIREARPDDLDAAQALLAALQLPTVGVQAAGLLVAESGADLLGLAGLEVHGAAAPGAVGLLRSVAVRPEQRSQGLARRLVEGVIQQARIRGLSDLYLLTTTAADYFPRFGFQPLPRSLAPAALAASPEFQGACPDAATLMHLPLNPGPPAVPGLSRE